MADPFSALTVSCAALQFLDFSAKFIGKTYKVYKSADGAVLDVTELDWAAGRLKAAAQASDLQQLASQNASPSERRLLTLCRECETFAEELTTDLAALKTKRKSGLRQSAKMVRKADKRKDELRAKEKRLDVLRSDMNAQLIKVLDDRQASGAARTLNDLQSRDAALRASIADNLESLRADIVSRLSQQNQQQGQRASADEIQVLLEALAAEARSVRVKQSLLESLSYDGMVTRRENIPETHAHTYEWIFSPDEDRSRTAHLQDWLKAGSGVFWVSGKPGSGKSTLMKFIHRHSRTKELLRSWAGDSKLVLASHFFWINGNDMQKSQEGLLREMCASLLRNCPDLFLEKWKHIAGISEDRLYQSAHRVEWPMSTLRQMLETVRYVDQDQGQSLRFVFFIDGLDEYNGDHEWLCEFLHGLASSVAVKICVAGRPWNVFKRALGGDEGKKLYMQRLTHDDISSFVYDKIGKDEHFQDLLRQDRKAEEIMDDIISRSNGVFLWVYLVERQVHRSLLNKDELETLRKRVSQMPSDLNAYFRHMLDSIDDFYCRETAHILQMCAKAPRTVPVLGFAIVNKESPSTLRLLDELPMTYDEALELEHRLESQVLARGQDLLEVIDHFGSMRIVSFMHRTVSDFLKSAEIETLVRDWSGRRTDVDQMLCEAFVLCSYRQDCVPGVRSGAFASLFEGAFRLAARIERSQRRTPFHQLDRLWRIVQDKPSSFRKRLQEAWRSTDLEPLVPLAVYHGLTLYMKRRRAAGHLELSRPYPTAPLLTFACGTRWSGSEVMAEMIEMLLHVGNDPNEVVAVDRRYSVLDLNAFPPRRSGDGPRVSVWTYLLFRLFLLDETGDVDTLRVCELFIKAGAKSPDMSSPVEAEEIERLFAKPITERQILEDHFGSEEAERLLSLRPPNSRLKALEDGAATDGSGTSKVGVVSRLVSWFSR